MDINDIVKVNIEGDIIMFADCTVMVFEDSSWKNLIKKAEKSISEIKFWLDYNLWTLNADNIKLMTSALSSIKPNFEHIHIHDTASRHSNNYQLCLCSRINKV